MSYRSNLSTGYSTRCTYSPCRAWRQPPRTIGESIWMTWFIRLNTSQRRNSKRREGANPRLIFPESHPFMKSTCCGTLRERQRSPRWGRVLKQQSLRIAPSSQKRGKEMFWAQGAERLKTLTSKPKTQHTRQSRQKPSHFLISRATFRTKTTQTTSSLNHDQLARFQSQK